MLGRAGVHRPVCRKNCVNTKPIPATTASIGSQNNMAASCGDSTPSRSPRGRRRRHRCNVKGCRRSGKKQGIEPTPCGDCFGSSLGQTLQHAKPMALVETQEALLEQVAKRLRSKPMNENLRNQLTPISHRQARINKKKQQKTVIPGIIWIRNHTLYDSDSVSSLADDDELSLGPPMGDFNYIPTLQQSDDQLAMDDIKLPLSLSLLSLETMSTASANSITTSTALPAVELESSAVQALADVELMNLTSNEILENCNDDDTFYPLEQLRMVVCI